VDTAAIRAPGEHRGERGKYMEVPSRLRWWLSLAAG